MKGKRDRALLALLLACGLRRHEAVSLRLDHLQQWEDHWAIVDLQGEHSHGTFLGGSIQRSRKAIDGPLRPLPIGSEPFRYGSGVQAWNRGS
jgi:integrase